MKFPRSTTRRVRFASCALGATLMAGAAMSEPYGYMRPLGPIAQEQRAELIWASIIILPAILPVLIGTPIVLWRYRRTNTAATYRPSWEFNTKLEIAMWALPTLIIVALSLWLAQATFRLDPYRTIDAQMAEGLETTLEGPPIPVDVVGLDWKWLYLYPELGVASVGELVIPKGHPVPLRLTTDTVMQSYFASGLAGQIFAMPGMITRLHLLADKEGETLAENTQYSGDGFADQRSPVRAVSVEAFEAWVQEARSGPLLTPELYARLAQRGDVAKARDDLGLEGEGPILFSLDEPLFFQRVVARYHQGTPVHPEAQPGSPSYDPARATLPAPLLKPMMPMEATQ